MSTVHARSLGLATVLLATLLFSLVGLLVRMAGLDSGSIVLWRSLFGALALGLIWRVWGRDRVGALRRVCSKAGLVTVALAVGGNIAYIAALKLTSVATVMTVYASLPFVTAAMGFLALGEPLSRRFAAAAALAAIGIVITAGAAISAGDIAGIVVSFVMTASWAGLLVQAKKHAALDLTLVSLLSSLGAMILVLPLVPLSLPSLDSLLVCALLGVLTSGLATVLALVGGRHIGSGETGLLMLLDVVLAPLWVWLAFGETVTPPVLLGGALVVAAVAGYLVSGTARRPARCTAP
ncbi:drug/metabolite transporter (DMT)-like permease [Angulomicrobium tetraedrale]|uniref:Drug/metabolite transporter (DMT)-like permease n=1 Tax=Ancylobacter tetraedralis TaxID=217068 RepID=A0A839ZBT5_9HYPH|nr:DMT family transporter [Ancylobacter tetraedralis]MBB3772156.1 drug/metabolite transporter (DMT)-like permease [Ancylobacter tetraedralis]